MNSYESDQWDSIAEALKSDQALSLAFNAFENFVESWQLARKIKQLPSLPDIVHVNSFVAHKTRQYHSEELEYGRLTSQGDKLFRQSERLLKKEIRARPN